MDSKNGGALGLGDIAKILARKFYRIAIPYYLMWLILWTLTSRAGNGAIWANTNITFESCDTDWLYTLLFVGNIFPNEMKPYEGCFQQAFPLQIDLQLSIFVPFLAIIACKVPALGIILSIALIIANAIVTIYYVDKYNLKAGFMAT